MRRLLSLAALLSAITAALLVPSSAGAVGPMDEDSRYAHCLELQQRGYFIACHRPTPVVRTAPLDHTGWTYLNLNYCPPNLACAEVFRQSMGAWRWDGTAWRRSSLDQGWVYVYPYSGQWRWAWTQQSGWVAVTGGRFELNRTYGMLR